jgi:hypothetical protein
MCLLSRARAVVSKHPWRPTRRRATVSARAASLSLHPKRAADRRHGARLLRSRRGSDLTAGTGTARGCYRTRRATRSAAMVWPVLGESDRPPRLGSGSSGTTGVSP